MEKFSLYDLLGLLLPGVLFLHFLGTLNNLFVKANIAFPDTGLDLGIYICFSLILGAVLYSASFYLTQFSFYRKMQCKASGIIFTSLNSCLLADRLREQGYMRNNVLDLWYKQL